MKAHNVFGAGVVAAMLFAAPLAWGQGKPVQVVSIDSDDAEDQADAFTGALKSRVRAQPGWQLGDSSSSLGPLLMALKCPPKPDGPCLGRMGEQLKADRFFWGTMKKSAGGKSVTLELHVWAKGKPDQSITETYSDNLKDQNDETLRKIAAKLFEKLTGAPGTAVPPTAGGTVLVAVHVNVNEGTVLVDGLEKGKIDHGVASIEVPVGPHEIEVRSEGRNPAKQKITATAGAEASVTFELTLATPPPPPGPSKPFPVKKVIGFSLVGLGVAAGVVGIVEGIGFIDAQGKNDKDHNNVAYRGIKDFCKELPVSMQCTNLKNAESARMLELVFFGIGTALIATGTILIITDKGASTNEKDAAPSQTRIRVVPSVGPNGGGVGILGTF